ncbi:PREDICTED: prostasin-like [Nanorana parkeri]|uniref:prostasin-like n=1 Tax=Nanorana parkeri TaxID=125878 RepID=UPI0008548B77|nr:PREDICTED: prostasin-like [Nanorana parkeri]
MDIGGNGGVALEGWLLGPRTRHHCNTSVNIASCQVQDRIVGGNTASIQNYPWQVNLRYQYAPACGASIISNQWLLTACHCFPAEHAVSDYDAVVGTTNLDSTDANSQSVLIDSVIKNPSYNEDAFSGDIALVKLKTPLTMGPGVGIISLLAAGVQIPAGLTCYVTGWGSIRNGVLLPNPKPLQVGGVQVISSRTCQCLHSINPSKSDAITTIQSDMICAGSKEGKVDACQVHSGGPLSCNINNKWYQIGVVSWGDECGAVNRPGVYILPSAYIDWIQSNVPGCRVESITIDKQPIPDEELGCQGADGNYYPYKERDYAIWHLKGQSRFPCSAGT